MKKIAILGGGMASLSTAYTLTNEPGWQEKYEITLYQLGWRLGGKTTTGRGPHDRIEEHGIHILQGWYDTTFKLLRAVFDERKTKGLDPKSPLQDLFAAGLQRNNTTLLTQFDPKHHNWQNWPLIFPEGKELPGDGVPLTWEEQLERAVALLLEFLLGSPYQKGLNPILRFILRLFFPEHPRLKEVSTEPAREHLRRAHTTAKSVHPQGFEAKHREILGHLGNAVRALDNELHRILGSNSNAEHLLLLANMLYYNLKGVLEDVYDPATGKLDFPRINKYDYREWLAKHGAPKWVCDSVVTLFFYTGTFSNLTNDRGGAIAADTALQFVLASTGYKGSFVFQFMYGTGDTMVMPLYQVLRARGVNFKFFHKVTNVHWSESGSIEHITIAEQVKLKAPDYDPVIDLNGLKCWPAEPRYEQINDEEARKLKADHINLESPWTPWVDSATHELRKGHDFHEVVLGIPIGVLRTICKEIIEKRPEWKAMVDNVITTPTQSAQLWILKDLDELGFDRDAWGLPKQHAAPNVVVYQNPMYSWLDSSLVLPNESWPADQQPKLLAYFTGPLSLSAPPAPFTDHQYQQQQNRDLQVAFRQWLYDNMGWFFPKATTLSYPNGLNFEWLADRTGATPEERYANQFFRANVSPTDHYTLSVPGSNAFRLKAGGSGFDNLFLCGDWIDFGINIGYIDGAIQSGQQAAVAVLKKVGSVQ